MNPNKTTLRALLHDLLPASDEYPGPDRSQVLGLLRSERLRRRRQQAGAALAALAILSLWLLLGKNLSRTVPSPLAATAGQPAPVADSGGPGRALPVEATRKPAPLVIEHVNDEQLITLLQGTPSALLEWPNGNRTLLVLKR